MESPFELQKLIVFSFAGGDKNIIYRSADKYLALPYWKKQWKVRHFSSDTEVIAAAETWFDGQTSEFFLSGLQKL